MMEQNNRLLQQQQLHQQQQQHDGDGGDTTEDGAITDEASARNYGSAMIPLGDSFEPGNDDVLVGRGKVCRNSPGNVRFRQMVESRLDDYSAASTKLEKSSIVTSILHEIRNRSPNGGFIKRDPLTGQWYEVGDFVARERITQSFRDALHDTYRSSNSSKKKRRKEELRRAKEDSSARKKPRTHENSKVASDEDSVNTRSLIAGPSESMVPTSFPSSMLLRREAAIPTSLSQPMPPLANSSSVETALPSLSQPLTRRASSNLSSTAQATYSLSDELTAAAAFLSSPGAMTASSSESIMFQQGGVAAAARPQQFFSLEEQIQALQQKINSSLSASTTNIIPGSTFGQHGGQQMLPEQLPYPSSWFRVINNNNHNSACGPMTNPAFSGAFVNPTVNNPSTGSTTTRNSLSMLQTGFFSNINNHSNITHNFNNQGVNPLVNANGALPPWQQEVTANTNAAAAAGTLDFSNYYSLDDNPFEPVPIAEEISRRNSQHWEGENEDLNGKRPVDDR